ncbi:MAG: hypothetical protein LBD35_01110, partial [Prevotellaceae bacterium]|nr:hypothetical protein [Prevotellaceae bacterium]
MGYRVWGIGCFAGWEGFYFRLYCRMIPYTLYPIPYTLYPIPYTLYPIPYTLYPIPHNIPAK